MSSTILMADKPSKTVEDYRNFLASKGHRVFTAASLEEMATLFESTLFSVLFVGSALVDDPDSALLRSMKRHHGDCKFVLITCDFNAEIFLKAMHCSVFHECLVDPVELSLLENVICDLTLPEKKRSMNTVDFNWGARKALLSL